MEKLHLDVVTTKKRLRGKIAYGCCNHQNEVTWKNCIGCRKHQKEVTWKNCITVLVLARIGMAEVHKYERLRDNKI